MKRQITHHVLKRPLWLAVSLLACSAWAREIENDVYANAVQNARQQTELEGYQPLGARMPMGFMLNPVIAVEERYESNVFRTPEDERSDFITVVRSGVAVSSDWDVHELRFSADGDLGFYDENSSEDFEDYSLEASGRLDVVRGTFFTGLLRQAHLHEFRSSPNDLRGDEPPEFDRTTTRAGFTHAPGRLKFSAEGGNEEFAYDGIEGTPVGLANERDRNEQRYQAQLGYELHPGYDSFVRYAFENREFEEPGSVPRDSDANEIVAGIALSLTGTLRGEAYAGYFDQRYDVGRSVDFVNYGGSLTWNITPLTSLQTEIYRDVRPTVFANASDYIETSYETILAHSLMNNVILSGRLRYIEDEFISSTGSTGRNDDLLIAGLGAEYMVARGVVLRTDYTRSERDSNVDFQDFTNHIVSVSAAYAY